MLMCACVRSTATYVPSIAEEAVLHAHGARVTSHLPLIGAWPRYGEWFSCLIGHAHVEDVFCELVHRVAARRRAAHVHLQRSGRHVGERDLDLHQMVLALGERQTIRDGRLRIRRGRGDKNEHPDAHQEHARC
jgi:hypothetical protein